nr:LysR family transcriptional regulator [Polyangiaceae bacterium]
MHTVQLSSFDLNLLVVLDALLETRSVKKAAARVSLSPSAVSHALSRLRDALADPLLVRAGRQLVLTPRAEGIRPRVHRALEELTGALRFEETLIPEQLQRTF